MGKVDAQNEGKSDVYTADVVFYAKDRWHGKTHATASWTVPEDVATRLCDALEGMGHTGPVRVTVQPSLVAADPKAAVSSDNIAGDGFLIEPFDFVRV